MAVYSFNGDLLNYNDSLCIESNFFETWVINSEVYPGVIFTSEIPFESNQTQYSMFRIISQGSQRRIYYDDTNVISYNSNGEITYLRNEGYKTITFFEAPTGMLLTWLEYSATKQ